LDVACGTGYGATILAETGNRSIVGVDLSREALSTACTRYPHSRVNYVRSRAESLPFASGAFGSVVCFETLEHVAEPRALLREVARVLTDRGTFIVSTPNRKVASPWWPLTGRPANPHHLHEYRLAELEQELAEWFEIKELWGQRFVSRFWLWLPVYVITRASAKLVRSAWAHRLYDEADGPTLTRVSDTPGAPRYFLAVCTLRGR
jgi:2-polyprenyl-3-methyl-5-hydroxy-6-metoxy-1,4-benzoquinol methylase